MTNSLQMRLIAITELDVLEPALRVHSAAKMRKLQRHIQRFGVLVPLLIDGDGMILDGLARYEAARAVGLTHLNVVCVAHLTVDEIRSLRLSLNRLQEEVAWEREAVKAELRHLSEVGFELDLTGFETVEIENFLEIGGTPADVEDIDMRLASHPVVSRVGDVWALKAGGLHHRIACGDSRDGALRARLMGDKRAAACFVDPPYNIVVAGFVSGSGKHSEFAMGSGEMTDPQFEAFLADMFDTIFGNLQSGGVTFACMDWRHLRHLLNAAEARKLELVNVAVWVKSNPGMGSFYRSQHELVAVLKRLGEPHRNNIELGRHGRSRSNVWQYRGVNVMGPERHLLDEHPTVKPSAMVVDAIRDVTVPGELVFDPFLGSGTTLIAAQRTRRSCYGIDIEPKFVDLAIRRWEAETGGHAVLDAESSTDTDADALACRQASANKEAM